MLNPGPALHDYIMDDGGCVRTLPHRNKVRHKSNNCASVNYCSYYSSSVLAGGIFGPADGIFGPADGTFGPADGTFGPADGIFGPADGIFGPAELAACK